jgi:hypothetical protein
MDMKDHPTMHHETDRFYLLRWFAGTLLGIALAGGFFACLAGRVFVSDSQDWQWFSDSARVFTSGMVFALICGVPACVLVSLLLHAAGGKTAADRLTSLLLCGLPAAMIVAGVMGAVGAFTGNCLVDALLGPTRSSARSDE